MPLFTALRQSRRLCGGVLLAVFLALLPLRGWAEAVMHQGLETPASAASERRAMPCHPAMGGDAGAHGADAAWVAAADADAPRAAGDASTPCSLCTLCHAPAVPAHEARMPVERARVEPRVLVAHGHAPPALPLPERPPRA
jgi:hypothetical protein